MRAFIKFKALFVRYLAYLILYSSFGDFIVCEGPFEGSDQTGDNGDGGSGFTLFVEKLVYPVYFLFLSLLEADF